MVQDLAGVSYSLAALARQPGEPNAEELGVAADNVRAIRPGNGLAPRHLEDVIGRPAAPAVTRGTPLAWGLALAALAFVLVALVRVPLPFVLSGVGGLGCILTYRRLKQ